jgi:hypothetical protein
MPGLDALPYVQTHASALGSSDDIRVIALYGKSAGLYRLGRCVANRYDRAWLRHFLPQLMRQVQWTSVAVCVGVAVKTHATVAAG